MSKKPKKSAGERKHRANGVSEKNAGHCASSDQFIGLPKNLQAAAARVTSSRAASIEFLKKGGFLTPEGKPSPTYTGNTNMASTFPAEKK